MHDVAHSDRVLLAGANDREVTHNATSFRLESDRLNKVTSVPDAHRVFVVHGRNDRIRESVFAFLRSLKLEPIEWTEAWAMTGKATPNVGEVLDTALSNAQAIVVVMTPDDEARLRKKFVNRDDPPSERRLTPQPRPNVLFEAGLAFGRAPDRTILVEVGHIRTFTDIAGHYTVRLDNSAEKRQELVSRLRSAGCEVKMNGTDWQEKGDLDISDVGTVAKNHPSDAEVKILKLLAGNPKHRLTAAEVAGKLNIHELKAHHLIEELEAHEYVFGVHYWTATPSRYALDSRGRAYLIEHHLL